MLISSRRSPRCTTMRIRTWIRPVRKLQVSCSLQQCPWNHAILCPVLVGGGHVRYRTQLEELIEKLLKESFLEVKMPRTPADPRHPSTRLSLRMLTSRQWPLGLITKWTSRPTTSSRRCQSPTPRMCLMSSSSHCQVLSEKLHHCHRRSCS